MRLEFLIALSAATTGCAAGLDEGASPDPGGGGGGFSDAGTSMCLSSNECPTGWVCNDFGRCDPPPPPMGDGGVPPPPEVEYEFGTPISSDRYIYVAMTEQDELARIDGETLAITSTGVGKAPRVVSAIPHGDGAVVLDSFNGTATIVRPNGETDSIKVLAHAART